ncbi:MAG: ABC transporter permease, partial [bacterium]|nr:ABC transporter permease [bacterium]
MKLSFAILYALKNLRRRKLRAVLTIFAVLIGTTLVSSMVSLGVGLQTMAVAALESAGELTDINVYQKDKSEARLDASAISRLENLDGVETVDPL